MAEVKAISGGEVRLCKTCGNEFCPTAQQIKRGDGIYCSPKCWGKVQRVEKVKFICRNCGGVFFDYPSQKGRRFCCNRTCREQYRQKHPHIISEEGREILRATGRENVKYRHEFLNTNTHTKPEGIFIDFYKELSIAERVEDTHNYSFFIGRLNPDFIIRDMQVAIFINGDYWHSPLLRPKLKETQRFDFQIAECKKHRWKALIIWESDLLRKDAREFVSLLLKKEGVL